MWGILKITPIRCRVCTIWRTRFLTLEVWATFAETLDTVSSCWNLCSHASCTSNKASIYATKGEPVFHRSSWQRSYTPQVDHWVQLNLFLFWDRITNCKWNCYSLGSKQVLLNWLICFLDILQLKSMFSHFGFELQSILAQACLHPITRGETSSENDESNLDCR